MLITESQMGFVNSKISGINLLEDMHYLSEAESVFSPALVPIVENTNVGANLIRLEDIISFAEANGIEDLGYALSSVCEASQVEPSTIAFTVQEENIIADDSLAELVGGIMQEGVAVIARPLNENNPMGILTDIAVEAFIESGDEEYINALCVDPIGLAETVANDYTIKKSAGTITGFYDPETDETIGVASPKGAQLLKQHEKEISSGAKDPDQEFKGTQGEKNRLHRAARNAGKSVDERLREIDKKKKKHEQTMNLRYKYGVAKKAGSGGAPASAPAAAPAAAAGGAPADPKQAESFLDKVKKYANKGRDAIAAVIAKLHKWAAGINYRIQNDPEKKGIWSTIKQKITAAIQFLTAKLHNAVAANRTDLAAKASEYNDAANTLD